MCVAINGLEYVRRWLLNLGEELGVESVLQSLEGQAGEAVRLQWRHALVSLLDQTPGQMLLFISQIISRIGAKVSLIVTVGVFPKIFADLSFVTLFRGADASPASKDYVPSGMVAGLATNVGSDGASPRILGPSLGRPEFRVTGSEF